MTDVSPISDYTDFIVLPLKCVGCWDWFPNADREYKVIINNVYLALVLFVLTNLPLSLMVNLYTEWVDVMGSLDKISDGLPLLVSVAIVTYFALHKRQLYKLTEYMNRNFKYYSARGLTNLDMGGSYAKAKSFAFVYTVCTLFSVTTYLVVPVVFHLWSSQPLQAWYYMDVTQGPLFVLVFLRQALGQAFIGLAMGQLGVFYAANAILLCGQLDLLSCSLRNVRYTAILQHGVSHGALATAHGDITDDEMHQYIYSAAEMKASELHYDRVSRLISKTTRFDIYSPKYDAATMRALRDCAHVSRVINAYKQMFEEFVSPLLVLRVVQVTLYLCTLLYAATKKFDMITVEYLGAVALDIFVYCYYGNKIISQADRVTTAAYQSAWHTMGTKPRRLLLNILLANRRPVVVRAGRFLPMDLHTFVVIIKTSFSYYTLLVNVNEKK